MLQQWLQGHARSASLLVAAPDRIARSAFLPLSRRTCNAHAQQTRFHVVCMAGLEVGKPLKTAAPRSAASSFEELNLSPSLLQAVDAAGLSKPTEIQSLAIPAILAGGDYLVASQTGSGKTLAYMLPLVHMFKQGEAESPDEFVRRPKRPKLVVLGPTKELVEQIASVSKSLCHHAKFRSVGLTANTSTAAQARQLAGPVDVVVATPTRLLQHMTANNVALGDVRWLVVDEADTMFDQGFGEEVGKLLQLLKGKQPPAQVVLVSATMTKAVKRLADAQLPNLVRLQAAGFHKPTAGARQEFRVVPPGGDKMQMLLELLQGDVRKQRKVLVFCGSVGSCRAVEHHCQDHGLPSVCYHGDMPIAARKESMAAFAGAASAAGEAAPSIMVASDLAARGLDFPGTIDHVINFDFPSNAIDYLHRAGRTARAGATGRVTSLVGPRDRRLATAIQYALDKDLPLDQVTASGAALQSAEQQRKKEKQGQREKGPTRMEKGTFQEPKWNPKHKFLHLKDGKPIVPFKDLLHGTTGDERKRLLYEIAMDVKEWRRWRHARAVLKNQRRREKEQRAAEQQSSSSRSASTGGGNRARDGSGNSRGPRQQQPETPQERWRQKVAKKKARAAQQGRGGMGGR